MSMQPLLGDRSPSRTATLLISVALVGAPGFVLAQTSTRLQVGSREIHPTITTSQAAFTISPPAPASPTVLQESVFSDTRDGRRILIKTTTETNVEGIGGDTLTMDAASLAPLALVTFGGGRTRTFRFDGGHITADIIEPTGARQHVDTTLAQPAFAGPSFFTVLKSLTITPSLDVTVPFFRPYDRNLVWVRYRSLGPDTFTVGDTSVPAWRVIGEIGGALALYWIRQDNHDLLRVVSFTPNAYGPVIMAR